MQAASSYPPWRRNAPAWVTGHASAGRAMSKRPAMLPQPISKTRGRVVLIGTSAQQLPAQWGAALDIRLHSSAQHFFQVLRGQAKARSDGSHVVCCQHIAGFKVLCDVERAAELKRLLLGLTGAILDGANGLPGTFRLYDQLAQLSRLQRERAVHPAIGTGQGKVLLDHRGAKHNASDTDAYSHCVVRQTNLAVEQFTHVRDGRDIRVRG